MENVNIKADVLYRLKSSGLTTRPLDEKTTTFLDDNTILRKYTALLENLDVSNYLLLTHESLRAPPD